jgi:hypothetical protein
VTDERRQAIEARLEWFNREADELWRLWHDPVKVAEHLADLLRKGTDEGSLVVAALAGLAAVVWDAIS